MKKHMLYQQDRKSKNRVQDETDETIFLEYWSKLENIEFERSIEK